MSLNKQFVGVIKNIGVLVLAFFALWLVGIALSYFNFDLDYNFLRAKRSMLSNKTWLVSFYLHLAFGAIAVLSGFPLFFTKYLSVHSKWHRRIGKIYIASILGVTGPTGFYLAFFAEGGRWASTGFILMSLAWMIPTYLAYSSIIAKKVEEHYKWIFRSYAMTLSGVTLRIMTPFFTQVLEMKSEAIFITTSYCCWILNLIVAELLLLILHPPKVELKSLNNQYINKKA